MPCRRLLLASGFIILGFAGASHAQPQQGNQLPQARLGTVFPCGAKAGTTLEVTLTGADLDDPEILVFSHPGFKATYIPPPPPPPPDPKAKEKEKQKAPPLTPKFTVAIDPKVPIGHYDVRLVGKHGITNSRTFVIGELTEVLEKEPNNDTYEPQRLTVNSTVTGVIAQSTDVDYYVFAGKKGQRVLVQCQCASIDSKLMPEIKLLDSERRQLAIHRAAPVTDGFVDLTVPEDGDYLIRLVQQAHQVGGQEYFYRLTITTGPWIDAVFPPVVEPGKTAQITLYGRNLPGGKLDKKSTVGGRPLESLTVTITPPKDSLAPQRLTTTGRVPGALATLDGFEYRLTTGGLSSKSVLLSYARAPLVLEKEPNDTAETAQDLPVPCELAARIDGRSDIDFYQFTAKKGDVFMIEATSQRLGAPTDLFMVIRNLTGKQPADLVQLDDNNETLSQMQLPTATRDPAPYRFVAPADGKYQVVIGNHQATSQADMRQVYTLRIAREQPDFRLIVMPADTFRPDACVMGAGGNQDVAVFVQGRDGFKGEVAITVAGLPPGITCKPQTIGPGVKQGAVVLNAALDAKPWTGTITVKGTAMIGGKKVVREARPASITWNVPAQSNIPAITRLEQSLVFAVRDKAPYNLTCGIEKATVFHGDRVTIPLKLTRYREEFKNPLQVVAVQNEMPQGVNFGNVNLPADKSEQNLVLNIPANVQPGIYNFVFKSFAQLPIKKGQNVNMVQCSTAVMVTVVPKQVAKFTVSSTNVTLKPGGAAELVVKVARQFDFADSFQVKLLLPKDIQGISAEEVTIPAGQNEAKLLIRADENATPGPRNNVAVQAVATVQGMVLTHEVRINVNVAK